MARRNRSEVKAAAEMAKSALAPLSSVDPSHVGDLVFWDLRSSFRGDETTVKVAFPNPALAACLPVAPDVVVAFGRAVAELGVAWKKDNIELKNAAPGPNGERRVAVCVVRRNGVVALDAHQAIVVCPRDGRSAYVETEDSEGRGAVVVDLARRGVGVYSADDVRSAVTRAIILAAGVPCRDSQPHIVYFVPPQGAPIIRELAHGVRSLGCGAIRCFAGMRGDQETRETAAAAVNLGIESAIQELRAKAAAYCSTDRKRALSSNAVEAAIADARDLTDRIDLNREILGSLVNEMADQRAIILAQLQGLLTGDDSGPTSATTDVHAQA